MTPIAFESFPSGADIVIEGEPYGQTPAKIQTTLDLIWFRDECITNGAVSCGWETLKARLEDQTVSMLWWDLTLDERHSIAHMATSNVLNYMVNHFKRDLGCGVTGGEHGGECSSNTAVRLSQFDHLQRCSAESGLCWWKRYAGHEWHNYTDFVCYNLPCYVGRAGPHIMPAIALREQISELRDLFLFQYGDIDIQPGNIQLKDATALTVYLPAEVGCFGPAGYSTVVVLDIPPTT